MTETRQEPAAEYVPLMTVDEHEGEHKDEWEELHDNEQTGNTRKQQMPLSTLTKISVYSAIAISLLALFLSLLSFWSLGRSRSFISSATYSAYDSYKSLPVETLRRPSLYLGLERVPTIKLRLDAEALLAEIQPAPAHGDTGGMHGHGSTHANTVPPVDGVVLPSAYARMSRLYPDMNWTDENVILTETVCIQALRIPALLSTNVLFFS